MTRKKTTTERGYGWQYQQRRARLLANKPPCHWCGALATTADHDPPMHVVGHVHFNLVPACEPCNYGRRTGDHSIRGLGRQSRDW